MSAPFRFKQFEVRQERAPMKVGTDGVLLGTWAEGGERILDVGTGTGLIAMMMAQRFEHAQVVGIDINEGAVLDAVDNVTRSKFAERVVIEKCALQEFDNHGFDSIVCNPPFFVKSLQCPNKGRSEARHSDTLNIEEVIDNASDILNEGGMLSVILPYEQEKMFVESGKKAGFAVNRIMRVRPTKNSIYKRVMIELRKGVVQGSVDEREMYIEQARHVYSEDYYEMTKEFYLDK